jgi:hypothetical protein
MSEGRISELLVAAIKRTADQKRLNKVARKNWEAKLKDWQQFPQGREWPDLTLEPCYKHINPMRSRVLCCLRSQQMGKINAPNVHGSLQEQADWIILTLRNVEREHSFRPGYTHILTVDEQWAARAILGVMDTAVWASPADAFRWVGNAATVVDRAHMRVMQRANKGVPPEALAAQALIERQVHRKGPLGRYLQRLVAAARAALRVKPARVTPKPLHKPSR